MLRRWLVVLAVFAPAAPVSATVYLPVGFTEMVTAAKEIAHGQVVDVRSELTADRRSIVTYVTMAVEQHLKGSFGESVTFRVPGGQVGRYRRIIVGAPTFERGDEVVVFLTSRGPSIPYLFGLSQGVYRVARLRDGRVMITTLPPLAAGAGAADRVVRGDPARRPLALEEFVREVKAIVESRK